MNCIIYLIESSSTDKVYIGSTIKSLNNRWSKHKNDYSRYLRKILHFKSSYDVVKFPDAKIRQLCRAEVPTKLDMYKLEAFYISQYPNAVNRQKPANQHPLLTQEHTCKCGTTCFLSSLNNHVRSKKHMSYESKK